MDERLIVVLGPTATGKTELGIRLAEEFDGEIVNADSRQVYRFMDVGTAKPTAEQRARAPHHLIDILHPDQEFGLAEFLRLARQSVASVRSKGRLPIVVGGTGQYIWALLENWKVPRVPPNPELRRELEELAATRGADALHKLLQQADAASAGRIDTRNTRRVIRALEIHRAIGGTDTETERKEAVSDNALVIGLTAERKQLYRMIDDRVDRMVEDGLAAEAANLVRRGYSWDLPSMSGVGYKEMGAYLAGQMSLEESIARIKTRTHRFARQQYNWFNLEDSRIHWLDVGSSLDPASERTDGGGGHADAVGKAMLLADNFLSRIRVVQ